MRETNWTDWVLVAQQPSRTLQKLESFAALPQGWHYGRGGPISAETHQLAAQIWNDLLGAGFTLTDAFPGSDGEVQLTAYHQDHFLSLMIEPGGETTLLHQFKGNDASQPLETRDTEVLAEKVKEIAGGIWTTYVCSTPKILTTGADASLRSRLNYRVTTEARQSFAADA